MLDKGNKQPDIFQTTTNHTTQNIPSSSTRGDASPSTETPIATTAADRTQTEESLNASEILAEGSEATNNTSTRLHAHNEDTARTRPEPQQSSLSGQRSESSQSERGSHRSTVVNEIRDTLEATTTRPQEDNISSFQPHEMNSTLRQQLLPLLRCPLCDPPALLQLPITLNCGHTVCTKHLHTPEPPTTTASLLTSLFGPPLGENPPSSHQPSHPPISLRCPLLSCTASEPGASATFVHPSSNVAFVPPEFAPAPIAPPNYDESQGPRMDITVSKVLDLVGRYAQPHTTVEQYVEEELSDSDEAEASEAPVPSQDVHAQDNPISGPSTSHPSSSRTHPRAPSSSSRPRKRRRLPSSRSPRSVRRHATLPPSAPVSDADLEARFEKDLLSELTCEICYALMWQPVSTPCQHTFCSKCLQRSLDHSDACPLCRQALPGFVYFQEHPCNKLVLSIILKAFPDVYAERGAAIEAEERDSRLDTPIFVCQLSFPGMPTFLHLFEPRYRLMLRRCLATPNPSFGMVPPPRPGASPSSPGNEYGTMLEIRHVRMLPDGRSLVETWGTGRFRIMERGMLDGYTVGRIERVDDFEEELDEVQTFEEDAEPAASGSNSGPRAEASANGSSSSVTGLGLSEPASPNLAVVTSVVAGSSARSRVRWNLTNEQLMGLCRQFLEQMRRENTPWVIEHLNQNYVPMPRDPAKFSFWMALLLPIDEREKAKLLPIRSPRLRLRLVVHWIEQLNSNWARAHASASRLQVVFWRVRNLLIQFIVFLFAPSRLGDNTDFAEWATPGLVDEGGEMVGLDSRGGGGNDEALMIRARTWGVGEWVRWGMWMAVLLAIVWAQVGMYRAEWSGG